MNTNSNVRPWQGTFLGVLNIIGLAFLGFALLLLAAVVLGLSGAMMSVGGLPIIGLLGNGIISLIISIAFYVLGIFITIGIFKGQKWTIYLSLAFTALGILSLIFGNGFNLFSLAIYIFMAWLEYSCLINPFYK